MQALLVVNRLQEVADLRPGIREVVVLAEVDLLASQGLHKALHPFQEADLDGLLADQPLQLGALGLPCVGMAVALEGALSILFLQLLPLADQVRVQLVFTRGLGERLARLDFTQDLTQDLLLKVFG